MAFGIAGPKAPAGRYGEPVVPNLNVRHLCPNCRSDPPNIIEEYSKGDLVCADCGTILGDRIVDTRSEWRTFAGDEGGDDPSRVGDAGNPLLGGDLSTVISSRDGRTGLSRELQRAQARSNAQRNSGRTTTAKMEAIFAQITEKCNVLGIPGIAQRAQHAYMIVDEHRQIKPREEATYVAACISFATRGVPDADRTLTEVCKAVGLSKKILGKALIAIKPLIQGKLTALKGGVQDTSGVASMTSSVDGLLGRYVNRLALGNAAHNIAKQISTINSAKGWTEGRSYQSVASGIVFFVITLMELKGEGANLKDLGVVSGTSETTIKLVRKLLAARSSELVRPEWQEQYARGYRELYRIGETANPDVVEGDETASNAGTDVAETPRDAPTPVGNGTGSGSANGNGNGNGNGIDHVNGNGRVKAKRPPSPLGQSTVLPTPTAA